MPISRHSFWHMTHRLNCLLEKPFGGIHVPLLAEHAINEVPITIDGAREITPCSMHFDVRFVDVPGGACVSTAFGSQLVCHEWSKTGFPVTNGLVSEHKATLQKHLGQIPYAQLLAESPEHDKQDDLGGIFQIVEKGVGAFIEKPLAS
jgi:hypothetical protein